MAWGLGGSLGAVFGNSLAAARLILSGMMDRIPNLDLIVTHLGGVLPYLQTRIADLSGNGDAQYDVGTYLRERIWTDNCSYHQPAFQCAVDTMGVDRILLGSDFPFRGSLARCVEDVRSSGLDDSGVQQVLHQNAQGWFA